VLRQLDGKPLMEGVHPLASLAPRDVVARTIDIHLKQSGAPHVLLDLSPIPEAKIERRFPGILEECGIRGLDIRREPVPVVPAAHYSCGGVLTDGEGRTSLAGLFAAGEVACTGAHGANRLASNSLLEAVVYSHRAALLVDEETAGADSTVRGAVTSSAAFTGSAAVTGSAGGTGSATGSDAADTDRIRDRLRHLMWEYAGIARSDVRLAEASLELEDLGVEAQTLYGARIDTGTVELRNLVEVSTLIVACARQRKESRGLHYNVDYPYRDNERFLCDTVMTRVQP
jgi:L-aspartate oxidase